MSKHPASCMMSRYTSLPLLGEIVEEFVQWLFDTGYQRSTIQRMMLPSTRRIDAYLRRRRVRRVDDISHRVLDSCWATLRRSDRSRGGAVSAFRRFLVAKGTVTPSLSFVNTRTSAQLSAYHAHLRDVRGYAHNTVRSHLATVDELLDHIGYERNPKRLGVITSQQIETFTKVIGQRLSRGSLSHSMSHIRSYLRYLQMTGLMRPGVEIMVDSPRLYRLEKIPRALPWDSVQALLDSIDRSTVVGVRNYTMLFLLSTYGLRVGEVVALTLDDIHWRDGWVEIPQRKTGARLRLPLTDEAGSVLIAYLRRRQKSIEHRELFLRLRAPAGPLKGNAVTMVFHQCSKQSGLDLPPDGAHCLRHSYAANLLRSGVSLKSIGDLLGHRQSEATAAYLRLATEDLREVPLGTPRADSSAAGAER